jgi:hypothetical protein
LIIVKLRKPYQYPISWTPEEDWLWSAVVSIGSSYTSPIAYQTLGYIFEGYNETNVDIGTLFVDNIEYDQVASVSTSISLERSWYFDITNQKLYVHIDHTKRFDSSDFDTLQIRGYSDKGVFYDDNDVYYGPFLTSSINIKDNVDRLRFSKQSFTNNRISFDNTTGEFDYAFSDPVPGADVNVLFISDKDVKEGNKTLTPIYTGFNQSQTVTSKVYSISLADKREQLNGKFPNTFFNATDFPNIESKISGDLIPEGYGELFGVPAICTNGTLTTGDVTYKYADLGTVLTTVYVLIDDVWTAKTPTASSGADCTFTLSAVDGRDSSGRYRKAKVDCTLRAQTNPADIIQNMIFRYLGFSFNSDYFNIAEWGTERALLSDISYYIDKREEFSKLITPIQNGSILNFIFRIDANGKFTIKVDDITRAVCCTYDSVDNVSDERKVETNFVQYATSLNLGYAKDEESGRTESVTVDTFKKETLDTYRLEQELEYDTLLKAQADAEAKGAAILKDYKKARDEHTIAVRGVIPQPLLDTYMYDSSIYLGPIKKRDYAGMIKFKVSGYSIDLKNEITTLTGFEINDIISKGTSIFTQGYMYSDYGYGDGGYYSPTTTYEPEVG